MVEKHKEFLIPIEACTISLPSLACQVFGATVCANSRSSWPSVLHFLNGKYCTWTERLEVGCSCTNLQLKTPQRQASGSDQTLVFLKIQYL